MPPADGLPELFAPFWHNGTEPSRTLLKALTQKKAVLRKLLIRALSTAFDFVFCGPAPPFSSSPGQPPTQGSARSRGGPGQTARSIDRNRSCRFGTYAPAHRLNRSVSAHPEKPKARRLGLRSSPQQSRCRKNPKRPAGIASKPVKALKMRCFPSFSASRKERRTVPA